MRNMCKRNQANSAQSSLSILLIELHKKSACVSTFSVWGARGNWLIWFYRFQLIRRQKHVACSFCNHIMNENWRNFHNQHFSCVLLSEKKFLPRPAPNNHIIGSDCIQFSKTILMSFVELQVQDIVFHSSSQYIDIDIFIFLFLIKC